jgi:dienelactone hydrolase
MGITMSKRQGEIPDVLKMMDGQKMTTVEQWLSDRRPEIIDLFREQIYGREPLQRPDSMRFKVETTEEGMMEERALRRQVNITFEGIGGVGTIRLLLFVPNHADKPVPAFLLINNRGAEHMDPDRMIQSPFWPVEAIVSRGYAAAVFSVEDVDPDHDDGFLNGVHGIFDNPESPRAANAWGTISAWAWGASRVMDYLETDPLIDEKRVGVVGHSRAGKTALWTGALDQRFAMAVSNNSGCTGAAISRGKQGETIDNINTRFPHWFSENYKRYNGKEEELPVDQHMLLSLIAPRIVYVASATEDTWADPQSEFYSAVLASQVYRMFGLRGLGTDQIPNPESPILGEGIGYHLRTGEHDLVEYDWKCFMDMADQSMGAQTKR